MVGNSDTQGEKKKYLDSHFFLPVFHQFKEYMLPAKLRERPDDPEAEWVSSLEV